MTFPTYEATWDLFEQFRSNLQYNQHHIDSMKLQLLLARLESAYWLLRGTLNILSQEMLKPLWQFYDN